MKTQYFFIYSSGKIINKTDFYTVISENCECAYNGLLHRDVEFDLSNLQIQISVFSYLHYAVPLTGKLTKGQFLLRSMIATKALLCREFSIIKTCSQIRSLR